MINNLYDYGIQDQGLLLIDQRIKNRRTICEWNGQIMGPIHDKWGLEQGGKKSSDFYKVYNNSQLEAAQDSKLEIDLGDVGPVSNDIFALQNLLELSLQYCKKHHATDYHATDYLKSSRWVKIRLHNENWLTRLSGSALKV